MAPRIQRHLRLTEIPIEASRLLALPWHDMSDAVVDEGNLHRDAVHPRSCWYYCTNASEKGDAHSKNRAVSRVRKLQSGSR